MPFKFNPITGNLDLVNNQGGDVFGPASSTDNAITRFDGTTGKLIQNSLAILGDSGDIRAQAFVFNREILNDVIIPDKHTIIGTDIDLVTGDIILLGDSELVLI